MNLMTPTCTFGIWHGKYNKYDSDSVSVSDSKSDSQSDYDGLMATSASTSTWPEHPNSGVERTPKMEILQGKTNKAAKCGAKGAGETAAVRGEADSSALVAVFFFVFCNFFFFLTALLSFSFRFSCRACVSGGGLGNIPECHHTHTHTLRIAYVYNCKN